MDAERGWTQARPGTQEVTEVTWAARWCLCSPDLGSPSGAATSSCRVRGAETLGGGSGPSVEVTYTDKSVTEDLSLKARCLFGIWGKKSALKYSALSAQTAGTVLATSDWHMLKGFGGLGDGGLALDTSAWKSGQWHVGIDFPVPFPEGQGCH